MRVLVRGRKFGRWMFMGLSLCLGSMLGLVIEG